MSVLTETAVTLCGATSASYMASVDTSIYLLLDGWTPDDPAVTARAVRLACAAVGTATGTEDGVLRRTMLLDAMVRVYAPAWLKAVGWDRAAARLRRMTFREVATGEAAQALQDAKSRLSDEQPTIAHDVVLEAVMRAKQTVVSRSARLAVVEASQDMGRWTTTGGLASETIKFATLLVAKRAVMHLQPRFGSGDAWQELGERAEAVAAAVLAPVVTRLAPSVLRLIRRLIDARTRAPVSA